MTLQISGLLAVFLTAGAVALVFGALLLLYRRLKGSFGRRTEELAESQFRFNKLVESLPVGIFICDRQGVFTFSNPVGAQMFHTSAEAILGKHYSPENAPWEVFDRNGKALLDEDNPFTHVLETGLPVVNSEFLFKWQNGDTSRYSISAAPILSARGELQGLIASVLDATPLSETREELEKQRRFFEQMFLQSSVATQIFDRNGNRIRANTEWCRLFDIDEAELARTPYNILEDTTMKRAGLVSALRRVIDDGITAEWEVLLAFSEDDATMRWFHLKAFPVWAEQHRVTNLIVHYEDISARKDVEEQMRKSLKEKEVLLKEVHHRVKNNMQVMKSMLNLQAGYLTDPAALSMFSDSASRINTMALIHEKLYQSEEFGNVDIRAYLTNIAENLGQTYAQRDHSVSIKTDLAPATLDLDTAIPCGLLANELLSNSMKHAFTDRRKGTIEFRFRELPADGSPDNPGIHRYELAVCDDGKGMPPGLTGSRSNSLGLKLVESLVYQLTGKMEVDSSSGAGTSIAVRFSVPKGTNSRSGGVEERES